MSDHWAITLYQRYVELYGEPIEQPIPEKNGFPDEKDGTSPSKATAAEESPAGSSRPS